MSGVELAGLALGTFPLLVSALEAYQNGFQPLKDWFKFHAEFISFIHDIQRQGVIYEDNLKLLLTSVCDCDEEKAVLLEDPLGEAWYDEDFRRRLQEQLPGSKFEAYMDSIQDVKAVIDKLKKKLGIDDDGKVKCKVPTEKTQRTSWSLAKRDRFANYNAWILRFPGSTTTVNLAGYNGNSTSNASGSAYRGRSERH